MKKNLLFFLTMALIISSAPIFVFADNQGTISSPSQGTISSPQGAARPSVPAVPTAQAKLENPLAGVNSISDLFFKIVNFLISFSYVIIAFFLILAGFKFVAAQGAPAELDKAKQMFYYTIIGGAIIIGAQTITSVVKSILTSLQ